MVTYGSEHLGLLESSYAERGWAAVQERRRGKKPWGVGEEGAQNVPSLSVAPIFHPITFQTESSLKQKHSYGRTKNSFIKDSWDLP